MDKLRIYLVDDHKLFREGLKLLLSTQDFVRHIYEASNGREFIENLSFVDCDVVLMDIEMPEMTGLELLSNLTNPPKVIIVSAYEQYALKGYEFEVVDYLLKPVSFDRFLKSANRIHDLLQTEQKDADDYIFVKSDKQLKKILFRDILFIESMENYVIIQTVSSKEIVYTTLKQIHESLPQDIFQQTHRSYIVNIDQVNAIDGNLLNVNSHKIPVARNLRDNVFNLILNNRLITKG